MAGSVSKTILVGNLGKDPEVRSLQSGGRVCTFSLATSESWKSKDGEKQTKTQWHSVVIWNEGLVKIAESYLKKGSKVYLEGANETRKYEKDGRDVYVTEVVLRPYRGELTLLDSKRDDSHADGHADAKQDAYAPRGDARPPADAIDDEIPF